VSLTIKIEEAVIIYQTVSPDAIDRITKTTEHDVTTNLIYSEEEVLIENGVENEKVFHYIPTSIDLTMWDFSSTVEALMENLGDREQFLALKIYDDSVVHFYGWINAATYDHIDETWLIGAVDFNKFITEKYIPWVLTTAGRPLGTVNPAESLFQYLRYIVGTYTTPNLLYFVSSIEIDVGSMGRNFDYDEMVVLATDGMTEFAFLKEVQKHFAAYFYIDTSGVANFINRMEALNTTAIAIDDDILDDTLIRTKTDPKYNSLLLNVYGDWSEWNGNLGTDVHGHYEGWGVLWFEAGEIRTFTGVNADLSNIEGRHRYLDLRQKLQSPSYSWKVFDFRDPEITLNAYKDVIVPTEKIECVINRIDINAMEKVSINSINYQVVNSAKNIIKNSSELVLKKL